VSPTPDQIRSPRGIVPPAWARLASESRDGVVPHTAAKSLSMSVLSPFTYPLETASLWRRGLRQGDPSRSRHYFIPGNSSRRRLAFVLANYSPSPLSKSLLTPTCDESAATRIRRHSSRRTSSRGLRCATLREPLTQRTRRSDPVSSDPRLTAGCFTLGRLGPRLMAGRSDDHPRWNGCTKSLATRCSSSTCTHNLPSWLDQLLCRCSCHLEFPGLELAGPAPSLRFYRVLA
jgi:hypothetical protein